MKKYYITILDVCEDCKRCDWSGGEWNYRVCSLTDRRVPESFIPLWCPLDDYDDLLESIKE